jgi:type VI secretion system protein ImpK
MRRGIGDEIAAGRTGEGGELRACTRALVGELIRLEDDLSGRGAPASQQPASQQPHSPQSGGGLATAGGNPRVQADTVQRRLNALLDHYAHSLRETGGGLYFAEADYALSALADELLLHAIDWPGAQLWREFLLERARFGTEAAGDRVFERIDALRAQPDPASSELAGVYLTVLAMGFQGRYRHGEPAGDAPPEPASELAPDPAPDSADGGDAVDPITLRRRQLFQIACLSDPTLGAPQAPLIRQAPPLDAGLPGRLPGIRRWTAVLAAVVVGYLLIGQGIWSVTTQPVEAELADWRHFVEDGARADGAAR